MTTRIKKQTFITLTLLAALLAISIACSTENQTKEGSAETSKDLQIISLDGSSTVFPVTEAVAEEYYIKTKGEIPVTVGVSGTGEG